MTGRSRVLTAILAVLIVVVSVAAVGCTVLPGAFTRTPEGLFKYTEGSDVWTLDNRGTTEQITLNEKLYAVVQNGLAKISLPDGRSIEIALDNSGQPVSIKAAWGVVLEQKDYIQMNSAFNVHKMAGSQAQQGPLGWVILLLLVIVAGLLLFLYAGRLVNSWKLGGIFNSHDTGKSLLFFKALGILLMAIGVIVLLLVVF